MTQLVQFDVATGVATITLDSPGNRNALSRRLVHELHGHLKEATKDPNVRVIVITATGPVFCAGGDLKERAGEAQTPEGDSFAEVLSTIMKASTPVVVKMNGPARAGGLGLVAAADISIAPTDTTFAFSEVRIGVAPAMIAVPCTRRMTPRAVSRYFLTGETFDASEAQRCGLVSVVTDDVDTACSALLDAFRLAGPQALRAAKALIDEASDPDLDRALKAMEAESTRLFSTSEAQEGMAAFKQKRLPTWADAS